MTDLMSESQFSSIAARLTAIRSGFSDLNQRAWAERHGFQNTQWNNWEAGLRRIPVESAERLCDAYGVTLDFIYRGRRDGLSETASKVL
jgi:transcriptional regulator with XRE-family HTH domain